MFPHRYVLTMLFLLTACSTPVKNEKALLPQQDGRDSTSVERLSPALRIEINNLLSGGQPDREVDILIKTSGPIDQALRRELEKRGCEIRSITGDIVTARAPARNVADIAGLKLIIYIDKSKKLYPK